MGNCFSFNPLSGKLSSGIPVVTGKLKDNFGGVHPPHIACGWQFLMVDRVHRPNVVDGQIENLSITRKSTKKDDEFMLASSRLSREDSVFLFFDGLTMPRGYRHRFDGSVLDAWTGFMRYNRTDVLMYDIISECYLIEFIVNGYEVDICTHDGAVYGFRRDESDSISQVSLSPADMAETRVREASEQLATLDPTNAMDIPRIHGIIGGISRLLLSSRKYPDTVNIFADFLVEHSKGDNLTTKMRGEIRSFLESVNHEKASWFYDTTSVVVPIQKGIDGGKKKREALAKKREKSEADKLLRMNMRGSGN